MPDPRPASSIARQVAVVLASSRADRQRLAGDLSRSLEVPLFQCASADAACDPAQFLLRVDDESVSLHKTGAVAALRVCFDSGREAWRRRHGGGRQQLIARAVGLHRGARPTVLDATAGLGRDAFVLASLGCRVTLLERSVLVHALLEDGLRRLGCSADPALREIAGRMTLVAGEATAYLPTAAPVDVVYLDPMFPESGRSAGVKKEMQFFRELLPGGDEQDAAAEESRLLAAALAQASCRVVVKRMKQTPGIDGPAPGYQLKGRAVRYDIYPLKKYY